MQLFRSVGSTVGIAIMGSLLNNILTKKLGDVQNDPFIKFAEKSGQGEQFKNIDVNSVQGILSHQAQEGITQQLNHLPGQISQQALALFHSFVGTLQNALAHSITQIFLASAGLMLVAFAISFFIKEIPLRHHVGDDEATPSPAA
jgi:hypothetical protein